MKIYQWVLIISMIVLSNLITLHFSKRLNSFKVFDLVTAVEQNTSELLNLAKEQNASPELIEKLKLQSNDQIQYFLRSQSGNVFLKQCVLSGGKELIMEKKP